MSELITAGFAKISVDMIKDVIDNNEKTFNSIELDKNFNENSTEKMLFNKFWQIGVRWKSCILLIENNHNIGLNILLRSIYESQRTLEFFLKDTTRTRTKLLAHQLNYVIEEIKSIDIEKFIPSSEINFTSIMEKFELTEISDLVLEKYENHKWKRFEWLTLFGEGNNFSEMARKLDLEAQDFGNYLYRNLSIMTHANNNDISEFISLENPFEEKISKKTLINLFTILGDLELVSELFIKQHYPSYLDNWLEGGRIGRTIQSFISILYNENPTLKDLEDELKKIEKEIEQFNK